MSIPIGRICGECDKHNICHNYISRGCEVTIEQLENAINVNNPCIDSDIYLGDFVNYQYIDGSVVNMVVQNISCNIIDDFLSEKSVQHHCVIVNN